ncbi:MAG TPA: hypothetical protein DEA22_00995 [Blastocatellia bacterium]|nr:hypothetical protein [Blastocatellia bacterium]
MKTEPIKENTGKQTRRAFAKSIVAAAVAVPIAAASKQTQAQGPVQPAASSPAAEGYFEVAKARFGKYVTPEQLDAVKRDLEGNVRTSERLSAIKLENGDEPDFVFGV